MTDNYTRDRVVDDYFCKERSVVFLESFYSVPRHTIYNWIKSSNKSFVIDADRALCTVDSFVNSKLTQKVWSMREGISVCYLRSAIVYLLKNGYRVPGYSLMTPSQVVDRLKAEVS